VRSWQEYWDGDTTTYVNRRHLEAHYLRLLTDVVPLLPPPPAVVLDFGCGEALMAPELVKAGFTVLLYDTAPNRQRQLATRYAGVKGITVLDDAGFASLPPRGCDAVLVVSVLQYVDRQAVPGVMKRLGELLVPGGRLVLADVIPPGIGMLQDVSSLLTFAAQNGFLLAALGWLAHAFTSDYRQLRERLGLTTWEAEELAGVLSGVGLRPQRQPVNVGEHPNRMTLLASPVAMREPATIHS
jgi:SAM-dependent methyltransferase